MAALTSDRTTKRRDGKDMSRAVAAATRIFGGSIVCLNATGFAVPGSTATTLKADGVARNMVDNRDGANGALRVDVDKGVFCFANSAAADAITAADISADAYIVDDQTVAKTNGGTTRSVAGKIVDVDAGGVWVRFA